jgi:hypothetical protein
MALTDKNILITPNSGSSTVDPSIQFVGANTATSATVTVRVYPTNSGTLSVEGSLGQLLSLSNSFTGTFFSVNDISGIPSITVADSGLVQLTPYGGQVTVGGTANSTSTTTGALTVAGGLGIGQNLWVGGNVTVVGTLFAAISGSVTTATNIQSGGQGQIPFQANSGVTSFFGPGTAGQLLVSAGTTSTGPVFTTTSSIFVGYANTSNIATTIAGGSANRILYQSSTGTTAFVVAPTQSSTYLFWNGTSFSWTNNLPGTTSTFVINNATQSVGTNSGALQIVNGGAGIGGNINVGGSGQIGGNFTVTSTLTAVSAYSAALTVGGGVAVGDNMYIANGLNVGGNALITGNLTVNGTATYVYSTNTYFTDNIIELHVPPGGVGSPWTLDDGKDIGLRFHYYSSGADQNGALVFQDSTKYLTWYSTGYENTASDITSATYGTFKTGIIIAASPSNAISNNTSSGALQVVGGAWINQDLYVGGNAYISGSIALTAANVGQYGIALITAGTDTAVSTATGSVTIWNTSTLQSITNRGSTTTNIIYITNTTPLNVSTSSGALQVSGGATILDSVGIGKNLFVGNTATAFGGFVGNLTGIASTATNLQGGTVGQIPYQSSIGVTNFFGPGTLGQILTSGGAGTPVYVSTGNIYVGYATSATTIMGGTAGALLYQSTFNQTSFLGIGTNGTILTSNGSNPQWTSISGLSAGTANTATNIGNGGPGQIPFQLSAGSTSFVGTGTAGQLLMSSGTSGPSFVNTSGIYVGYSNNAINSVNIVGGTAGQLPYQVTPGVTSFTGPGTSGQLLSSNGTLAPTYVTTTTLYVGSALYANQLYGGQAGALVLQTASSQTGFLAAGSTGSILVSVGPNSSPAYTTTANIYVNSAVNSQNLIGGSTGALPYQSAPNTTSFLSIGTNGYVLTSSGTGPTWQSVSGLSAGSASTASNIAGGTTGQIVYQTNTGSTSFAGPGTLGQLLVSQGANIAGPLFVNTGSIMVGAATTATNIAGGGLQQIVYQSSAGQTNFIGPATAGNILVSAGTLGPPVFTNTGTFQVGYSQYTNYVLGGTAGQLIYQSSPNVTAFIGPGTLGQLLVSAGTSAPNYQNTNTFRVGFADTSTNLAGGVGGAIPYQSAVGATTFLNIGTNGYVLTSNGSTPTWQALSGLASGSATSATNISGGSTGQVPYQTGAGSTNFFGPGTAGQLLISQGASTLGPVFTSTSTILVGAAVTATNISSGTNGQLVYQISTGTTGFVGPGSQGQLLVSNGALGPVYSNTSSIMVQNATLATNIIGGNAGAILYQNATNATTSLPLGTLNYVLTAGSSAPTWTAIGTLTAGQASTASNVAGGGNNQLIYQVSSGVTSFVTSGTAGQLLISAGGLSSPTWAGPGTTGQLLVSQGTSAPLYTTTSSIFVGYANTSNVSTNIAGGTAGALVVQTGTGQTTFVPIGLAGQVLAVNPGATAPIWQYLSGLSAGYATTATNLANGAAGQIPWQSAVGLTSFTSAGTTGQLLYSNGTSAPSWVPTSTAGNVLTSQGAAAPAYQNTMTLSGSVASTSPLTGVLTIPNGGLGVGGAITLNGNLQFYTSGVIQTQGTTAIIIDTSQRVGIGSGGVSPTAPLHVYSSPSLGSSGGSYIPVFTQQASGGTGNNVYLTDWRLRAPAGGSDWTTEKIHQGVWVDSSFTVPGSTSRTWYERYPVNGSHAWGDSASTFMFINGSGQVGINTTSPTSGYILDVNGSVRIANNLLVLGTINASITGVSNTATNVGGGSAGQLLYQSASGITAFYGPGTAGQVLTSNGTSGPLYVNTGTLYVGAALGANTVFGGTNNQILYQASAGSTAFITAPTVTGTYLQWNGSTFVWNSVAGGSSTATNVAGGTTGQILYQSAAGTTNFAGPGTAGQILVSQGASAAGPLYTNTSSIYVGYSAYSQNVFGGTSGNLVYQSAANTTAFVPTGASGTLLTGNTGAAPSFVSTSSIYVGAAQYSNNLLAGSVGQVPYQTSGSQTGFFGPGTAGQLLMSQGATAPAYVSTSNIYVNSSVLAETIRNGATNQILYQSAANTTAFMTAPTNGTWLNYFSTGGFTWNTIGASFHGLYIDTDGNLQYDVFNSASGAVSINMKNYATSWFSPSNTSAYQMVQISSTQQLQMNVV